jgi:hypothetical protein
MRLLALIAHHQATDLALNTASASAHSARMIGIAGEQRIGIAELLAKFTALGYQGLNLLLDEWPLF